MKQKIAFILHRYMHVSQHILPYIKGKNEYLYLKKKNLEKQFIFLKRANSYLLKKCEFLSLYKKTIAIENI